MHRLLFAILSLLLALPLMGQVGTNGDTDYIAGNRFYEKKDYANALTFFQRAANGGNADALNNLGVMYHYGEGVAKDFTKAAEWYRKAAEKNHAKALYNLGILYQDKEDFASAAYWYGKAVEQGHSKAMTNLATLYYYGIGVSQNNDKALELYGKAAGKGDEKAKSCLAQLRQQIAQNHQTVQVKPSETAQTSTNRQPLVVSKKKKNTSSVSLDDVDTDIPHSNIVNNTLFAVIIGNEKYDEESDVPYAENDATMFKEYCKQTLGISEKHIRLVTDAGYNDMRKAVNWLQQGLDSYDGEGSAIFYYAGHGIPNEAEKTACLLPTDGSGSDIGSAISLAKLYERLGKMRARNVTVFLDACFSGAKRDGGMMQSSRGVALKIKPDTPQGRLVVFSAAQEDETAFPFKAKQHGMFTYYLLKKLQQSKGDVTLGDLADYIIKEVKRQSFDENNRKQTPMVRPSQAMTTEWRKLKIR